VCEPDQVSQRGDSSRLRTARSDCETTILASQRLAAEIRNLTLNAPSLVSRQSAECPVCTGIPEVCRVDDLEPGVAGCGPSPIRTGLPAPKLPANREIYREFAQRSGCVSAIRARKCFTVRILVPIRAKWIRDFWAAEQGVPEREQGAAGGRTGQTFADQARTA
jgi:hypothetical protein